MSIKSWKAEFYPITAKQAVRRLDLAGLVEHSIQKWTGLRKSNLKKHELESNGFLHVIMEDENGYKDFEIGADSCALCVEFLIKNDGCSGCPLFETLGVRCDGMSQPYNHWTLYDDPAPMINALKKALRWARKQQEEK